MYPKARYVWQLTSRNIQTDFKHDFQHFPISKEISCSPKYVFWTDLIIPFSTIFIPSKSNDTLCCLVRSNYLVDLFRLMQSSNFFLKHNTRATTLFNLDQLEFFPCKPATMSSCTNAAQDLASLLNSGSSVSTSTSTPLPPGQLFSFYHNN